MKKKKNSRMHLIVLLAAVAVVIAGMFGVEKWRDSQEEQKNQKSSIDVDDKLATQESETQISDKENT